MAAPVTTARGTPFGHKLTDGFSTTYAFAALGTAAFWEKVVKPPGIDGGAAIPISTMLNTVWRTFAARSLKTLSESNFKAAYNPHILTDILSLVNVPGSITAHFPDAATWDFFGYLMKVDFDALEEGKQPEGSFTIVCTNYDPVNKVEQPPVYTAGTGT